MKLWFICRPLMLTSSLVALDTKRIFLNILKLIETSKVPQESATPFAQVGSSLQTYSASTHVNCSLKDPGSASPAGMLAEVLT
jgi:hypothetical protein